MAIPLPAFGVETARALMDSGTPILASIGRSAVLDALTAGETVPPDLAASAWFCSTAARQRSVVDALTSLGVDDAWLTAFSNALVELLPDAPTQRYPWQTTRTLTPARARSRRVRALAKLLAGPLAGRFSEETIAQQAGVLLESDVEELINLVQSLIVRADAPSAVRWLRSSIVPPYQLERILPSLRIALSGKSADLETATATWLGTKSVVTRCRSWRNAGTFLSEWTSAQMCWSGSGDASLRDQEFAFGEGGSHPAAPGCH